MSIKILKYTCIFLFVSVFLSSCNETENRYSTEYPCNFTFYTQYHTTSILKRVFDNPGLFVYITIEKKLGINHIHVYPNNGDGSEDIAMTTEIENNRISYDNIGANKSVIIGCSTLNEWHAYDRQCPYCLSTYTSTNYPLTWVNNGQSVYCAKCKRTYNLAYGASDDGHRLIEYRVRYDGNILTVRNN